MNFYQCVSPSCDWAGERPEATEVKREAYDEETGWHIVRDYRAICPKCASDVGAIAISDPAPMPTIQGS